LKQEDALSYTTVSEQKSSVSEIRYWVYPIAS
jgi:hypothetical protein